MRNRLANVHNQYQNQSKYKRVLCVCSAGLLRSPTMAYVLSQEPYNYNTRAAGINEEYALIPVDMALVEWADEIVFAEQEHCDQFLRLYDHDGQDRSYYNIKVLGISDEYNYRDPDLVGLIGVLYSRLIKEE